MAGGDGRQHDYPEPGRRDPQGRGPQVQSASLCQASGRGSRYLHNVAICGVYSNFFFFLLALHHTEDYKQLSVCILFYIFMQFCCSIYDDIYVP